jgi:ribosomal protein S18 acetylase RimI-like enzyme
MRVSALDQPDRFRPFLWGDRFFADYALGDLDPAHFPFTEWFGAEDDGDLRAVVMLYNDLTPPIFFATGDACGIEAILDQAVNLPQISLSIREEHLPVVEKFYRAEPVPMLKMALLPKDFKPVDTLPDVTLSAAKSLWPQSEILRREAAQTDTGELVELRETFAMTKLGVSHMPLLEELYSHGGGDAFRQRSLELGVFYGVFEGERLVSVAGTHIVSDSEHIAALGNVMTHPAYHGRGLATRATSAVCKELLDRGIEMIGLSVSRTNEAAIRVYEKIGFNRYVPFYEGTAIRR